MLICGKVTHDLVCFGPTYCFPLVPAPLLSYPFPTFFFLQVGSRRLISEGSSGWRALVVSLFLLVFCKVYLPLPAVNLTCICQTCCATQDLSWKTEAPSIICSEGHWMQGTGGAEKTKGVSPLPRRRWGYRCKGHPESGHLGGLSNGN